MLVKAPADLGAMIRERRRRLGLDQQTLADRAGVSRLWLIGVEKGKSGAAVGLVLRTLAALGITLSADAPEAAQPETTAAPNLDSLIQAAKRKR